jgi:hypothetical protein
MSEWQRFLTWCSEADEYPEIFHLTRDGQYARIGNGGSTLEDLVEESMS